MLPVFHTNNKDLQLMQNSWTKELNPLLNIPQNQGIMLENIELQTGSNTINHLLGRKMQGWYILDQDALASIYRSKPLNATTLTLTSTGVTTLKIWIF